MPIQARKRLPLASSQGIPDACTFVPGAWPITKIFADADARNTGLGSGIESLQSWQLRISVSKLVRSDATI